MIWTIELTTAAANLLANIADRRIQRKIKERIDQLARDPEKQGKALTDDLAGYRSLQAVGQRYRINLQGSRKESGGLRGRPGNTS